MTAMTPTPRARGPAVASRTRLSMRLAAADDGIGMLLVIGLISVVTILGLLIADRGTSLLFGGRAERGREQAIALADGAVNDLAYRASISSLSPLAGTLKAQTNIVYPSDYASWSAACERAWLRWALNSPTTPITGTCGSGTTWTPPTSAITWHSGATGTWTWLYPAKPAGGAAGVFYGAGRAATNQTTSTRIVRVDATIAASTFNVNAAVLTNTDLQLTGSGKISGPGGNVHTNSTLSACCNNGVSVNITFSACNPSSVCTNAVTSSCTGTGVPSGCAKSNSSVVPVENIPTLTARTYYPKASYVLCAGASNTGEVRLGPGYTGALGAAADPNATPCTSGTIVSPPFAAWTYTPSTRTWTWNSSSSTPTVTYYAYGTNATIQSSATSYGSVIAEGLVPDPTHPCNLTGGSVSYGGSGALSPDPAVAPIGILADGPLTVTAAGGAFNGVAYTNQYLNIIGAGGGGNFALISNDTHQPSCGTNVIQGAGGWTYDGTIPLNSTAAGVVTQTSWLER